MMNILKKIVLNLSLMIILFVLFSTSCRAATYYVSPAGNDNTNLGTETSPWQTIQKAARRAIAGDKVFIRGGTYNEILQPLNSGSANNPITFSAYQNELVTLNVTSATSAISIVRHDYILVENLTIEANQTASWADIVYASHNIIRNCFFNNATKDNFGVIIVDGSYNQIINNNFYHHGILVTEVSGGVDALKLDNADRNLIENNRFEGGVHGVFAVISSYNVIRKNYFQNDWYRDTSAGYAGAGTIATHNNLWEENTFASSFNVYRGGAWRRGGGIQLANYNNILRQNIFYQNQGGALGIQAWNESPKSSGNRVYNNVFYKGGYAGLSLNKWTGTVDVSDNIFKNNIFYKNYRDLDDNPETSETLPHQIYIWGVNMSTGLDNNRFVKNDIFSGTAGEDIISSDRLGNHPLFWWQTNYPDNFSNNLETNPNFIDETNFDFHLQTGSPLIDAGTSLTTTVNAGSGTALTVTDAKYFSDGLGIVNADWIKIGNSEPVQVNSVNYETNVINLATSRSWNNGDPVNLYKNSSGSIVLSGNTPDIGAYEYISRCTPLGDIDCSGKVNILDLSNLLSTFGSTTNKLADLDNSGKVNMIDLSILLQNFGK